MKQVLEFEKPAVKLREELEDLRKKHSSKPSDRLASQINELEQKLEKLMRDTHNNLNPWQRVQISRHINRPFMLDYVKHCCEEFIEIHGDRHIGDDAAMPAGFAIWAAARLWSSAIRRAGTPRKTCCATLAAPIRKVIARRCVS